MHHQRPTNDRGAGNRYLALLLVLLTPPALRAAEPPGNGGASVSSGETLDLAACLGLALQRQPRVSAARASLAAAEDAKRALDALHVPSILDPEIPVRRRQACLGVSAAVARLEQVERETVYAVTRTYFTVVFAREQERVARRVVGQLSATNEAARKRLENEARDANSGDVDRSLVYLRLAQTQQSKAATGVRRALIALREAIGAGPECRLDIPDDRLPEPDVRVNRDEIVAAALTRRAELAAAGVFVETSCLEVEAQASSLHRRLETFAAGADIHARPVPQGEHNDDYRPGAIAPEMPGMLAGSRPERIKHAQSLYVRAGAVAEVTRNLITLEAEDAFLRWEEASQQVLAAREAADAGDRLAQGLNKDFTARLKVRVEDVINGWVLASQARSRYNESLYHEILALADLERISAGTFCAGLVGSAVPRPASSVAK
jgi:outer membrane protein TolC